MIVERSQEMKERERDETKVPGQIRIVLCVFSLKTFKSATVGKAQLYIIK